MKYFSIWFTIAMALLCKNVDAQDVVLPRTMSPGLYDSGTYLHQVVTEMTSRAQASDTGEGGFADRLATFQKFWQTRVFANDSTASATTKTNMFSNYYRALRYAVAEREAGSCGTSGFHGDWSLFGPSYINGQVMGRVDGVWADPNDSTYILAATQGGLFRTTNGGTSWQCGKRQREVKAGAIRTNIN